MAFAGFQGMSGRRASQSLPKKGPPCDGPEKEKRSSTIGRCHYGIAVARKNGPRIQHATLDARIGFLQRHMGMSNLIPPTKVRVVRPDGLFFVV